MGQATDRQDETEYEQQTPRLSEHMANFSRISLTLGKNSARQLV